MKFLRAFFLFVAMFIVVVHAITPHRHHEVSRSVTHLSEHQEAESFLDLLVIAFHHEQYEGQLEIYDATDNVDFEFQSIVAIIPIFETFQFAPESEVKKNQTNFDTREKSPINGEFHDLVLRGPPAKLV